MSQSLRSNTAQIVQKHLKTDIRWSYRRGRCDRI